jgi:hypothetical protein
MTPALKDGLCDGSQMGMCAANVFRYVPSVLCFRGTTATTAFEDTRGILDKSPRRIMSVSR